MSASSSGFDVFYPDLHILDNVPTVIKTGWREINPNNCQKRAEKHATLMTLLHMFREAHFLHCLPV